MFSSCNRIQLQLTLPCRERLNIVQGQERVRSYNSRSPAESDWMSTSQPCRRRCYNSRSPAESDEAILGRNHRRGSYNSRSPAESDPIRRDISSSFISYNSRSSAESDANRKNVHFKFFATTPALLRRATGMSNPFESVGKCYNSRSPAESDGTVKPFPSQISNLQRTLTCGERIS